MACQYLLGFARCARDAACQCICRRRAVFYAFVFIFTIAAIAVAVSGSIWRLISRLEHCRRAIIHSRVNPARSADRRHVRGDRSAALDRILVPTLAEPRISIWSPNPV